MTIDPRAILDAAGPWIVFLAAMALLCGIAIYDT